MRRGIRPLFLLAYFVATVAWLICLLAYYIPPTSWKLPIVFSLGFPVLIVPQAILSAYGLFKRKRWALLPVALLLMGWPQLRASVQLGLFQGDRAPSSNQLSVTSYNLKSFHQMPIRNQTEIDRLIGKINFHKRLEADIVCFQESFGYLKPILKHVLSEVDYPYHYSNYYGNAIFSKYPIINKHYDPLTNKHNGLTYVDIVKGADTIRVIDIHLQSLSFEEAQFDAINDPLSNNRSSVYGLLRKVVRGSVKRQKQVSMVLRYVTDSPYPVILCSDLNATPTSYAYQQFSGLLQDSFVEAGRGYSPTYAGPIPGLRIDYVFSDARYFKVEKYWVDYNETYSDHYPVKVILEVK